MWISVKAFIALEARDLVKSPNKESGIAASKDKHIGLLRETVGFTE